MKRLRYLLLALGVAYGVCVVINHPGGSPETRFLHRDGNFYAEFKAAVRFEVDFGTDLDLSETISSEFNLFSLAQHATVRLGKSAEFETPGDSEWRKVFEDAPYRSPDETGFFYRIRYEK